MANIAITTYCNLRCPYCFANEMICTQNNNISLDKFEEILQWISKTPKNHVGIIGGEPTIHPKFEEILKELNIYCRENLTNATIFTNGIYMKDYINLCGDTIHLLINVNAPENMTPEQTNKMHESLRQMYDLNWFNPIHTKANIGCNLYAEKEEYNYIFDIAKQYQIDSIRMAVTAPIKEEHKADKHKYYKHMKPIFMNFVQTAYDREIQLHADCSQIPDCYFNFQELELINQVVEGRHNGICEPVVDITPEMTATACFGCYDPISILDFENLIDLERYLLHKKTYPRVEHNNQGKCKDCPIHELLVCQGGCLGFADEVKS